MEDTNHENPTTTSQRPASRGRIFVIAGVALVAIAGVGAIAASAQDFGGERRMAMERHGGPGMFAHHASWRGGHGFGMHRMLDEIDATDEQQDKLEDIFDTAHDEIRPLMREFRDTREDLAELLAADTIDSAAIETLRAERVAAIDEASKKLTAALVDAAGVLTPEQRKELADHFEDHRGFRRW